MMNEDERYDDATLENTKTSKRDRLKGALARTKSKFKKHGDKGEEAGKVLSDDVNDFLSAGRPSTSSWTSGGDTLPRHPMTDLSSSGTTLDQRSPRPSTSDSFATPKQSPRRIPVPRIDVSNSQRWPGAQPIGNQNSEDGPEFLRPEYQARSQSVSSLSKRKGRGRGLSVSFIEAPPVIIGEGGDDAPKPPVEISKARARARSVSPMTSRSQSQAPSTTDRPAPINGSPSLHHVAPRHEHGPPDVLRPRTLQRVQTGLSSPSPSGLSGLDKEFDMTLRLGSGVSSPESAGASPITPEIVAPKPVRPVHPPPPVFESAEPPGLKKEIPSANLRKQFREGDALKMHHDLETPDPFEDPSPGAASSRGVSPEEQRSSRRI
ncbi:uncharacterized protein Z518_02646 [Rhinocladiella mackenziei CBS 650.93]|uniref:Uncharacterized protein n=1 Tax=Rhinocladiella mackenziei CBS 650.93 TaxID=1442369 RepID=A0A0D2G0G4_9EURO|nr:uncharacterized protein Z518_02646 [Rhinocladiella mackenziei CBS 650.93]KIX07992.1 hypothetical protein Z518_02646 [Rhinocladiella mackenziei CBS 650.93]